jgi:hypothetical protein
VIYGDTSQNKEVIVKPLPEPPPISWLNRRPIVLSSAATHDDHGPNLPVVSLLEYPSRNRISISNQKGHSKNRCEKYQAPIYRAEWYSRNLEIVSEQTPALKKKITVEKPGKDPGFRSKREPDCIEEGD